MELNNSEEYSKFISDLRRAKNELSLICFIGAGVSISQGYPNWNQYVNQLITYWTYHLGDIVRNEDTIITKVELNDIQVLETLIKSNGTNKRKVDLVNYLIKEYCDTGNEELTNQLYKKHVLDFEKMMFSDANPSLSRNQVLDDLVKLQPAFITTNYDKQIENSYRTQLGINPDIIPNISAVSGNAKTNSVIHLHGIPETTPELFVSSSQSYRNIYLEKNEYKKVIEQLIFGKKNPVVLFIGCSMEEDEVLSLLKTSTSNIKFYSLMKQSIDHYINEVNKRKNDLYKKYYTEVHRVHVLWYGTSFDDLPGFVNKTIEDFENTEKTISRNPKKLRRILTDA